MKSYYHFLLFMTILWHCIAASILTAAQIAELIVQNPDNTQRLNEYLVVSLQSGSGMSGDHCLLIDTSAGDTVFAQVFDRKSDSESGLSRFFLIAPVDLGPHQTRTFHIANGSKKDRVPASDLVISGKELDLVIDNKFYRADLRRDETEDGQRYHSGQLNRLEFKDHGDLILSRKSNRMHWGPNFRRSGEEDYTTTAHWDPPDSVLLEKGPYLIRLLREGPAPGIPEINVLTCYYFLAGQPYFTFYSEMRIRKDVSLSLLRNDEMTMDSLFTNVAFNRGEGPIEDYTFAERDKVLHSDPVPNSAPWLCFYNAGLHYAYGSIRILYDIRNDQGLPSPTYMPHTKISNGAGGGKYWNRRLIHEKDTFVPAGSCYREENAYLLFDTAGKMPLDRITALAEQLRHPVLISVRYPGGYGE
jgi:hypothetical protein